MNLSIEIGERVVIFGRNGAGKTTFIKLLAGLMRPTAGSVHVSGRQPWGSPGTVRARIGLVSHQSYLYGELSARENLRFYARLYGLSDLENKTDDTLARFALENRSREPVRNLSRGLQQRVSLARAMLHDPQLLLLDEPDTGLDPSARQSLQDVLHSSGSGLTAVIATHDIDLGMTLGDRTIVLDSGRIVRDSVVDDSPNATAERDGILETLLHGSQQ
jgi:heme exporter protein A